jgi:hypothetical protein
MKELSIIGASPSVSTLTEEDGTKRVVKTSGYERAKERTCERWCVSSVYKKLDFPVDKIFQLHHREVWEDWVKEEGKRVIVALPDLYADLYPVQEMLTKYGPVFGSSISWMLALAIEKGFQRINIYGVDMATRLEYVEQRDTFFYFCGRAEALGIEIWIPEDSRTFFKDRIYGVL